VSGYLARLIARSNGSEAVVRPLLTHEAGPDLRDEILSAAAFELGVPPDSTERRTRAELHRLAEPVRTIERSAAPPSADRPAIRQPPAAASRADAASSDGEPQNDRATFELSARPAQHARDPFDTGKMHAAEAPPHRARRRTAALATGAADDVEPVPLSAAHAVLPPPEHRSGPTGTGSPPSPAGIDRGPVIRIAIGRIEVRANVPRSSPAPAGNAAAGRPQRRLRVEPKLTLETYLRNSEARR
jgi:hypothetical protein